MKDNSRLAGQHDTRQRTSPNSPPDSPPGGSEEARMWRMFGFTLAFLIFALVVISVSL